MKTVTSDLIKSLDDLIKYAYVMEPLFKKNPQEQSLESCQIGAKLPGW